MRWIVRGDIDGFFGLAVDNLVQLLLIDTLCRGVLGFPADLVYGRILPGAAISVLVGNLAYAHQARQIAAARDRPVVLDGQARPRHLLHHRTVLTRPDRRLARKNRQDRQRCNHAPILPGGCGCALKVGPDLRHAASNLRTICSRADEMDRTRRH